MIKMTFTSGNNITADRIIDINDVNLVSGFIGLDGVQAMGVGTSISAAPIHPFPNNPHLLRSCMAGGFGRTYANMSGAWDGAETPQTDFDYNLMESPGYIRNSQNHNKDSIIWSQVLLNAGTYTITLACVKSNVGAILELVHGATVIGSIDQYTSNVTVTFNFQAQMSYTPTTRQVQDLILRVNGRNAANQTSTYFCNFSRLEFRKTA